MIDTAAFQATFTDWRLVKGRKQVQIVLEVPLELADRAYQVLGGMPDPGASVWVAVARLNAERQVMPNTELESSRPNNELPAPVPEQPARAQIKPEKRLTRQAAILCAHQGFQRFLNEQGANFLSSFNPVLTEEDAAQFVRDYCGVESRSAIAPGSHAARLWDYLYGQYLAWRDAPELAKVC